MKLYRKMGTVSGALVVEPPQIWEEDGSQNTMFKVGQQQTQRRFRDIQDYQRNPISGKKKPKNLVLKMCLLLQLDNGF